MIFEKLAIKYLVALVFVITSGLVISGQSLYFPKIIEVNGHDNLVDFGLKPNIAYESKTILSNVKTRIGLYKKEGRVFSTIDTTFIKSDTLFVFWYKGDKIDIALIIDSIVQKDISFIPKKIDLDTAGVVLFHKQVLEHYNSKGYPFAKSAFTIDSLTTDKIQLNHEFEKGEYITWDTISIPDSINLRKSFLSQILNVKQGQPFDIKLVNDIKVRMRNLTFVQLQGEPQVKFIFDQASIILPLIDRPASRFDFIIGVLPSNDGNRRVWNINGEFMADMINKFGFGERISAVIKRLSLEDQLLKVSGNMPFLLGSAFGIDGDFELRRNRNLTLDVLGSFGIHYNLSNTKRFKAYWNLNSSSLINVNTTQILAQKRLPKTLDYSINGGGLEFWYNKLDYIFNPRKGNTAKINISLGQRKIIKNQEILALNNESINFSTAYDSIRLKNVQIGLDIDLARYTPISNWGVNKTSLTAGLKYNNDRVVENDLYRLGGNRLMRGFDELTLLHNFYAVATTEFRLILDQNSFLSLPFFDLGFLQTDSQSLRPKGVWAMGVGLGMNFSTKAGIFNISFAAGNYDQKGFDFANTKIHFGYVNLF